MKEHEDLLFQGREDGKANIMEVDADEIARILRAHGAPLDVAVRAANAIVDYLVKVAVKAGALPEQ